MKNRLASAALMMALLFARPQPAIAGETNVPDVNATVQKSTCLGVTRGYPSYPFSVARLERALSWPPTASVINVVVFDNGFLGYRLDREAESAADHYQPTRNFPAKFFGNGTNFRRDLEQFGPPWTSPPGDQPDVETGHGTSIVGLVLGGMYDDDRVPDDRGARNLVQPNVRALLGSDKKLMDALSAPTLDVSTLKPWLRLSIVKVNYDQETSSKRPMEILAALSRAGGIFAHADIINMSLGRVLLDQTQSLELKDPFPDALLVAAAGNGKKEFANDFRLEPASAVDELHKMLVVASYDSDGKLSNFSNYGEPVTLAAPGCDIKSWLDGDRSAVPLSGTSMSAALTSFAAALTKSRWDGANAIGLRNRLISSARYSADLENCVRGRSGNPPKPCVKDGSALDIEAAVAVDRDFVEYESCTGNAPAKKCSSKVILGLLQSTPESFASCMGGAVSGPVSSHRNGLTFNGSIKRLNNSYFRVFYEPGGAVGQQPIATSNCPAPPEGETLSIIPEGTQLDDPPLSQKIDFSTVQRIVSRVQAP